MIVLHFSSLSFLRSLHLLFLPTRRPICGCWMFHWNYPVVRADSEMKTVTSREVRKRYPQQLKPYLFKSIYS